MSASQEQTYRLVVKKTSPGRRTPGVWLRLAPSPARPTIEREAERPAASLPLGVFGNYCVGSLEFAGDCVEREAEVGAHGAHHGHGGDGNQRSDQTIFDRGCSIVALKSDYEGADAKSWTQDREPTRRRRTSRGQHKSYRRRIGMR